MSKEMSLHNGMTAAGKPAPKLAGCCLALPALVLCCAGAIGTAHAQMPTAGSQLLPVPVQNISTVPKDGDTNPYGVAFVPQTFVAKGLLAPGDLLVSNFNNSAGMQGTGTSITLLTQAGAKSTFFKGTGLGLSTGLAVLSSGYVMAANVPTTDGTCSTLTPGSLIFLNSSGIPVLNYANPELIDEPWDATVYDMGTSFYVFVSNAGNGTISRLLFTVGTTGPTFKSGVVIAGGYMHSCTSSSFIVANTGLAYDWYTNILYVASTGDNTIYQMDNATETGSDRGRGDVLYTSTTRLHGPNALIMTPNGHLIAGNSDFVNAVPTKPSEYVEITPGGQYVGELSIDPAEGGSFGLGLGVFGDTVRFAAVDDNTNSINIWTLPLNLEY